TDAAGNVSAPASFSWVIDTAEPTTMITGNPPNPSSSPDATFTFTGDDGGGSGVASFLCQLDGGGYSPCTSPKTYTGLADGSPTFPARGVDPGRNEDHTPTHPWANDTGAPGTLITSAPPALTASTSANITFAGNDVGGTGV